MFYLIKRWQYFHIRLWSSLLRSNFCIILPKKDVSYFCLSVNSGFRLAFHPYKLCFISPLWTFLTDRSIPYTSINSEVIFRRFFLFLMMYAPNLVISCEFSTSFFVYFCYPMSLYLLLWFEPYVSNTLLV